MIASVNDSVAFGDTVPLGTVGFSYKNTSTKYGSKKQRMNVFRISTEFIESR